MKNIIKFISIIMCCFLLYGCFEEEIIKNTNYTIELDSKYSVYEWKYEITNQNILSVTQNEDNKYTVSGLANGSSTIRFTYSDSNSEGIHGFYYTFSVDEYLNVKLENEEKW